MGHTHGATQPRGSLWRAAQDARPPFSIDSGGVQKAQGHISAERAWRSKTEPPPQNKLEMVQNLPSQSLTFRIPNPALNLALRPEINGGLQRSQAAWQPDTSTTVLGRTFRVFGSLWMQIRPIMVHLNRLNLASSENREKRDCKEPQAVSTQVNHRF